MTEIFVALGSNMGDRLRNLAEAVDRLQREPGFVLRKCSAAYETDPVGGPPQGKYLNAVAQLGSMLTPRETLRRLLAIEEAMGRVRREKDGPREIDLDLLLFGDREIVEPGLHVPHPRMHLRAFVQVPLAEIAPQRAAQALDVTGIRRYRSIPVVERAEDEEQPA